MQENRPASAEEKIDQQKFKPIFTDHDKLLLDLEPLKKFPNRLSQPPPVSPEVAEQIRLDVLAMKKELKKEPFELPPQRKYPWPIDIFLYPISKPGLIMFLIFIAVPLLLDLAAIFFSVVLFSLIIASSIIIMGVLAKIVIAFYVYWYLCECVRDSAAGGIRAPETLAITPSVGELVSQILKLVGCFAIFWGPFIWAYFLIAHGSFTALELKNLSNFVITSWLGQITLAFAIFFFPVALLRVCTFEFFIEALNPLSLLASIFAAFLPYCLLVLAFCFFAVLVVTVERIAPSLSAFGYFFAAVEIYLLMILSHLLGRFYWRYKYKLNWDV